MEPCHHVPGDLPHHAGRGTRPLLTRSAAACGRSSPPSRTRGRLPGLASVKAMSNLLLLVVAPDALEHSTFALLPDWLPPWEQSKASLDQLSNEVWERRKKKRKGKKKKKKTNLNNKILSQLRSNKFLSLHCLLHTPSDPDVGEQ